MNSRISWSLGVLLVVLVTSSAVGRTWTSRDGKTIEGDFVDVDDERATLKLNTGKEVKVRLDLLCDDDQQFLRGILARRRTKKTTLTEGDSETPALKLPLRGGTDSQDDEDSEERSTDSETASKKKLKAENRTWTDLQGNQVTGKFVRVQGSTVVLLRGGRQTTTDYWKLSAGDQEYVKEYLEAKGLAHLIPKLNPNNAVAGNNMPAGAGAAPVPNFPQVPMTTAPFTPMPPPSFPAAALPSAMPTPSPTYPSPSYPSSALPSSSYPGSSFPNPMLPSSSYTGPSQPTMPITMPTIPTYEPPSLPTYQQVKICTNCNKEVSSNVGAGDSCPHCGTYFAYDETTGKHASAFGNMSFRPGRGAVKLVVGVVVLVIAGIASAIGAAARAFGGKKKQESEW